MEIELPDGTVLDAPDDADPSVVAKGYLRTQGRLPTEAPVQGAGRQVALAGRAVGEGVLGGMAGLAEQAGKAMTGANVVDDALIHYTGKNRMQHDIAQFNKMFGANVPEVGSVPELLSALLTNAGAPVPETSGEKLASATIRGASGALATPGSSVAPVMTAVSGATSGAASEATRQAGGGPMAQFIAGMAGGVAPGLIKAGVVEGTKRLVRGGASADDVQANIDAFEAAGTSPTMGQATESRVARAAESLGAKAPGSAGVMAAKAKTQAEELGAGVERTAASLAPKSSSEQAGRAITEGIKGEGGFTEAFRKTQSQLYDKVDDFIPKNAGVSVNNTRLALAQLNADIEGAPQLSRFFKNSKLQDIEAALKGDTTIQGMPDYEIPRYNPMGGVTGQPTRTTQIIEGTPDNPRGTLPYEALKKVRTLVGQEIDNTSLADSVPRSKWKALYGALTSDMEVAAKEAGPQAEAAFTRANNYTRAGMRRLETVSSVLDKNGGPEAVFQAATSGTKEGATTLRAVMQSLPEDAQKTVSATVLRRLGRAKPGMQNELGEAFSTETFLTNWNGLSSEAKAVLFNRYGSEFRQNMDQIAKVASNLREGSQVFKNPAGTASAGAQIGAIGAFFGALASGNYMVAGGVAGGVGTANLAARLMTHPPFVAWLAKSTRAPVEAIPALTSQLARSSDPLMKEAAGLLQQAKDSEQDRTGK